jgi:general secretion pathway protein G
MKRTRHGFTLIELLVVLAIIATLFTLVAPRYFAHVERSREVVLKHNLMAMRDAIDRYHADRGAYPSSLQDLVSRRYLRELPLDPITERNDTWRTAPAPDGEAGIYQVHSGAPGKGQDGTAFNTW